MKAGNSAVKLKQPGLTESGLFVCRAGWHGAITVPVDRNLRVAGFFQLGDYVDVLAFISVKVLSYNGMDLRS